MSEDLVDTDTLRSLGLCINTRHHLLLCVFCQSWIVPAHVPTHIKNNHPNLRKYFFPAALEGLVERFNLCIQDPPIPTQVCHAIQGIAVVDALSCSLCRYVCPKASSMLKHHQKKHSMEPRPNKWISVPAQQYNQAVSKVYFQVAREITLDGPVGVGDTFERISDIVGATKTVSDVRNIAPWLRITKWHLQVEPYSTSKLLFLVSVPALTEFPTLKLALSELLEEASDMIDATPILILQKLNSPDWIKQ
jgi:hypothetical protein